MNPINSIIKEHPFVKGIDPAHLETLSVGATQTAFATDQIIFRQGEYADRFYLILDGRIAIESEGTRGGSIFIQALGPGEVLGWSWLFQPYCWHFQARALEPTKVVVLNAAHLLIACEENHDFGYELMKRIVQVVIQRMQATRKRLLAASERPANPLPPPAAQK